MEQLVPWDELFMVITPYAPASKTGGTAFAVQTIVCIHYRPQWSRLSDWIMEEAMHYIQTFRESAELAIGRRLPDESTILRFRCLQGKHQLAQRNLAVVKASWVPRV